MENLKTPTRVGFKAYRPPENITDKTLKATIERIGGDDIFVYYTGGDPKGRRGSLRNGAFATILGEKGKLVTLSAFLTRAARALGATKGFDPATVKAGVGLNAGVKDNPFLYLARDYEGNIVAVKDIPIPDRAFRDAYIKRNEIVFSKDEVPEIVTE